MSHIAEFYLDNGNHIKLWHNSDVSAMIEDYEQSVKEDWFFGLSDYEVEELYYNGKKIDDTNFSIPVWKVDLHRFEG